MSNKALNAAHVAWSRSTFRIIKDGGTWGVPRSGLIFVKRGDRLELIERMPHHPDMPVTSLRFRRQQLHEYLSIKKHFGAAGIAVIDATRGWDDNGEVRDAPA